MTDSPRTLPGASVECFSAKSPGSTAGTLRAAESQDVILGPPLTATEDTSAKVTRASKGGGTAQDWSPRKKWSQMLLIAWQVFLIPASSTLLAPALADIAHDLDNRSGAVSSLVLSAYMIGFAFAGLLAGPLSEVYGRLPIYHVSNVSFVTLSLASGFAPSAGVLVTLRALTGALGTGCLHASYGTWADVFAPDQRARAGSLNMAVVLLAPCVGPPLGGLVSNMLGWRWILYLVAMVAAANTALCALFLCESLPAKLQRRHQKGPYHHHHHHSVARAAWEAWAVVRCAFARPSRLLCSSPPVMLAALYAALSQGILYLLFSSIPFTFGPLYGWSTFHVGLVYLAPGLGMLISAFVGGHVSDRAVRLRRQQGITARPSDRVLHSLTIPGTALVVAGLLVYGWTCEARMHVSLPLVGLCIFGSGILLPMMCSQLCVLEFHMAHAASVAAATNFVRSLVSGLLPLAGLALYDDLGFGWGGTILAALGAVSCVSLLVLRVCGESLHSRFRAEEL